MDKSYFWNRRSNKAYTELTDDELEELLAIETLTLTDIQEVDND